MSVAPTDAALRADAQRNRRQLLEAAARAFAERGIDVPAGEIAALAGVAKGTLFRHFPTKRDLVVAVLIDRIAQLRTLIGELEAGHPPGIAAVAEVMARGAAVIASDQSFFEAACERVEHDSDLMREKLALESALDGLVAAAQASGEVRGDVTGFDLEMLMMAATNTCAPLRDSYPELYRRYLALMIDGLRAGATTPLPAPPIAGTLAYAAAAAAS